MLSENLVGVLYINCASDSLEMPPEIITCSFGYVVYFAWGFSSNAILFRSSVQQRLKDAKSNILHNKYNKSRYYSDTIIAQSQKESRVVRLFMSIAAVYLVTFLPNSLLTLVVKTGGLKR